VNEAAFLAALRRLPLHPGARGLRDDAATIGDLVVTTDTQVEGVHFLPTDPAADVAWKLVATNLSDLAAKGAAVEGITLNYPLTDDDWDTAFLTGLAQVLAAYDCPLIGGDTVSLPPDAPRVLTVTAFGRRSAPPARDGARPGDVLWVTGTIGDAGAGLAIARGAPGPATLLAAFRRPLPRLPEGTALAAQVTAMMDVSDGLLLDAGRMADASGVGLVIDLAAVPLSAAYRSFVGDDRTARLAAATAGDDYQLLFALPPGAVPRSPATRVGLFNAGTELTLHDAGEAIALPPVLGFRHGLRKP
jgi:thiamine-monophosphate kinase